MFPLLIRSFILSFTMHPNYGTSQVVIRIAPSRFRPKKERTFFKKLIQVCAKLTSQLWYHERPEMRKVAYNEETYMLK